MRIWVELPEEMMARLDELSRARNSMRQNLIRQAIAELLAKNRALDATFGMWADRGVDGMAYQDRLRTEWKP